jgi:hypothetical protein
VNVSPSRISGGSAAASVGKSMQAIFVRNGSLGFAEVSLRHEALNRPGPSRPNLETRGLSNWAIENSFVLPNQLI